MKSSNILAKITVASLALGSVAPAAIMFTFADETAALPTDPLDGGDIGDAAVGTDDTDPSVTVTLTTVDILVPEYVLNATTNAFEATGATVSNGQTNIPGNADALGINNLLIGNSEFEDDIKGNATGGESSDFNAGESWVFEFDTDVILNQLEWESLTGTNSVTVLVDGVSLASFVFNDDGELYDDPLAGLVIAAGSDITLTAGGDIADTEIRLESLTVTAVVPEPSGTALLGLAGLLMGFRRKRS